MRIENLQVKDHPFLTTLFKLVDRNGNGYVEFDELVGELVFFMRAPFKRKLRMYCEVLSLMLGHGKHLRQHLSVVCHGEVALNRLRLVVHVVDCVLPRKSTPDVRPG